ncbi:MAG: hypothetical protein AAGI72_15300 [Pseudomonadota bacterium]
MKITRPCYAVVVSSDAPDDTGQPIIWETPLGAPLDELKRKANQYGPQYGRAWIIELPIMLQTEVIGVAGSQSKVVYRSGESDG